MKTTPNPIARRFKLDFFVNLPREPAVYFMRSRSGEILYVGKAKNLRSRLLSYRYARWGTVGDNILALLNHVRKIDWEICDSEERAIVREREIIRALLPKYNVADAWQEEYLYIGLRAKSSSNSLHFRLTDREDTNDGYKMHGCFSHRRLTKDAYSALLRVFAACVTNDKRYSLPGALCKRAPAYEYKIVIPQAERWRTLISAFLNGKNKNLLTALVIALLENSNIPEYARPALQRDLRILQDFAESCIHPASQPVTHKEMRENIRQSISTENRTA